MKQQNKPKVSILTPVFNGMKHLEECIASVSNQNYTNFEHVFADGGSTDGTLERLRLEVIKRPNEVKLVVAYNDKGVGDGLQRAYKASQGEIIGWVDADDRLEPGAISQAVKYFEQDSKVKFIYGNCNLMDAQSRTIGAFVIRDFDKWEWVNRWHYIVFCSTFFKREVIENVGFVNSLGNDVDFYLRAQKKYSLKRVDELFSTWRLHVGGISLSKSGRETKIRRNRSRQDFFLVLRNHGSLLSPKSIVYMLSVFSNLKNILRFLPYPAIKILKKFSFLLQLQLAGTSNVSSKSFSYSFFKFLLRIVYSKFDLRKHILRKIVSTICNQLRLVRFIVRHLWYYLVESSGRKVTKWQKF